ncbi:MAG TPA: YbhB/YbcL family Raf kinase inhibitor-like protein [Candidatus Paceibacterota bacterium]|nr:YbhB/YbcL family Raf kinase inhibitor-like protein [Candidatus Paceibacterota bacterium]
MRLTSPAFENGEQIPTRYTCDGEGTRPPLEISGTPEGARSIALIVDDLDASDGPLNFLHWSVWNVHPHTTTVKEGKPLPGAVLGQTSFGTYGWGAPCPPEGVHRYRFRAFALTKTLDVPRESTADELEEAIAGHVLGECELMGTYRRDGGAAWHKVA